jgi:hypothetical protein
VRESRVLSLFGVGVVFVSVTAEAGRTEIREVSDRDLYAQVMQNGAFNEYRCQGKEPDDVRAIMDRRYKKRIDAVNQAMKIRYSSDETELEEFVGVAGSCKSYRGAIKRLDQNLRLLEQRLDIK